LDSLKTGVRYEKSLAKGVRGIENWDVVPHTP